MSQLRVGTGLAFSMASALLLALSAPPLGIWPLALIGLVPLYLAIREAKAVRAFALGWLSGFIFNLSIGPWWAPLLQDYLSYTPTQSWLLTLLICTYQGTAFAIWAGGTRWLVSWGVNGLLAAPLVLALVEALLPYPFDWYLGSALWRAWPLIQIAELGGPAAVSALLVLVNVILAEAVLALRKREAMARGVWVAAALIVVVLAGGTLRATQVTAARDAAPKLQVGILQPNFGIVSMDDRKRHGRDYVAMLQRGTQELAEAGAELVIWPESMWPYLLDRALDEEFARGHPWELRRGAEDVRLLFGALTHDFGTADVYNSAVLVGTAGDIAGRYDKNRLIPFGEYIPFEDRYPEWAESMRERMPEFPDVLEGTRANPLVDGNLRVAPMICSEDLQIDLAHQLARESNLLVALTNVAWFGDSGAPEQHLAAAALRAVETRRDYVRATNTGVSAVIDATGRVRMEGPLYDIHADYRKEASLLRDEVALLEMLAIGPVTIAYVPHACMSILIAAWLFRWSEHRSELAARRAKRQRRRDRKRRNR